MIINKVCLTTKSRHFSAVLCHDVVEFKSWSGWIYVVVGLNLDNDRGEFRLLVGRIKLKVGRSDQILRWSVGRIKFRCRSDQI